MPAAAINTLHPLFSEVLIKSITSWGVLWADRTFFVYLTPNESNIGKIASTTGKSESEPIKIATCV